MTDQKTMKPGNNLSEHLRAKKPAVVINGVFAGRRASGIERFAVETLKALDGMVAPGRFRLLVPRKAKTDALPLFKNIEVVRRGILPGPLWEQFTLPLFARRTHSETLSLTNTVPLLRPGIACLHDVFYITHEKQFRATLRGRLAMAWHRLHYKAVARTGKTVFTVSEYSRRQISELLQIPKDRIVVLGNGWEHVRDIACDDGILRRNPALVRNKYFFVLGNRSPYKNLSWVVAAAKNRPETTWAVAGAMPRSVADRQTLPQNVISLGRVSDGEMKALMQHCRALVHPSLDEGFGIPPLEALALGRPAVVARAACLPEIFGDSVGYIDRPEDRAHADAEACMGGTCEGAARVLARHTWKNVAEKLCNAIS